MRLMPCSAWFAQCAVALVLLIVPVRLSATDASQAPKPGEPTDPKARKTYQDAKEWEQRRAYASAVESFLKANQQDGGHCTLCMRRAYELSVQIADYKNAEAASRQMLVAAATPAGQAAAHYLLGVALQKQGMSEKKDKFFEESCGEFKAALGAQSQFTVAHYSLGVSLARLKQDDAARQEFSTYLAQDNKDPALHERAERYVENINLARARMAPAFSLTTLDEQKISMDGLAGKVVLIDFWATWCGPCREALPHMQKIVQKFSGQPLVVLSISLDKDDGKWREFVAKNNMTWLQYRDGGFDGSIAKMFGVSAIPATFSIDADGVLEDQHVGDADIEGKLKKMIAHAAEMKIHKPESAPVNSGTASE